MLNTLLYDWEEAIITKQLSRGFDFLKKYLRSIYNRAFLLCMEMGFSMSKYIDGVYWKTHLHTENKSTIMDGSKVLFKKSNPCESC